MRHTFRLPDPGSPEITVDASPFTGLHVEVDGRRLTRLREGGPPAWRIPMADGSTRRVAFGGQLTGLQAILEDGSTIQIERRLALWELVLAAIPFGLLGLTGIAGGVLGLFAVIANLRILREPWPLPVRLLGTMATLIAAGIISWVIAMALFA
jgi:hypothetical protein